MVIIAIHQPNYLPWLGFFHKIYTADVFILYDTVQFTKLVQCASIRKTPDKKNLKKKNQDQSSKKTLCIPLLAHSHREAIANLEIIDLLAWITDHLNQISFVYRKSPFFDEIFPTFEDYMGSCRIINYLSDINYHLIRSICNLLGIKTQLALASTAAAGRVRAAPTDNLLRLIKYFKGTSYLSGTGAKKYQDENRFRDENIKLIYQDTYLYLEQNPYPQTQGTFVNGLSIIDALFNIGVDGVMAIFEKYEEVKK